MFYNWPGRYAEIRAFSGLRWKTHVPDRAMKIAEIRNCSESGEAVGPSRASRLHRLRIAHRDGPGWPLSDGCRFFEPDR